MKEHILKILGDTALDSLSVERLLDVLHDKIKSQAAEIETLKSRNSAREIMLHHREEQLDRELKNLRMNPNKLHTQEACFELPKKMGLLQIIFNTGHIKAYHTSNPGKEALALPQVSPGEFYEVYK